MEERHSLILGFFDGVHKGHREVIKTACCGEKSVLITFKDSPALYFGKNVEYILPREKSYEIIKSLGVDEIVEQDFSTLAEISADDYLDLLVKKYSPVSISTGFNHTFGKGRLGNSEFLTQNQTKYNYKYFCSPACVIDDEVVSSTKIREFLMQGNIEKANEFLDSNFLIKSTVIEGAKLGRQLGFPTANMIYPNGIVRIPYGVYAVKVSDKPAILNWGVKPTVNGKTEFLEVHIPNYEADLYNLPLEVEFIKKIRDEKKFANLDELKHQIKKDVEECLKL
ncbi:MAG: riboflavin biosynthesis protein RibF [Candidatus Gastranaerophilales bacterium]|nr:riboflavin biosynthesis protein RibF [Candidatus Gastranaerophilales bacterium]MCM1072770.1 riboflavin biosynthesis protein RibF [Bacteroides sp.]